MVFPLYMLAYPTFNITFSLAIRFPVILGLTLLVALMLVIVKSYHQLVAVRVSTDLIPDSAGNMIHGSG